MEKTKRTSIWNSLTDFWLLGGLSILVCLVMHFANIFKNEQIVVQTRFLQLATVFSFFSILCNHPHFMISYRFGYGRGTGFIFKNWFALLFIPLLLIALYGLAFFYFDKELPSFLLIEYLNAFLKNLGFRFRIGEANRLGEEVLGLSVWFMYLTVGWHYAKQVYGCMMVYAFYDEYALSKWQKNILKWSVYSVAFYQFIYMSNKMDQYSLNGRVQDFRFQGVYMSALGAPEILIDLSQILLLMFFFACLCVFYKNYRTTKRVPSWHFLIPWISLYIWWIPFGDLPEFYLFMVPFFHSLQYLPFAFRLESSKLPRDRKKMNLSISIRLIVLLIIGILSFELIPSLLDAGLQTSIYQTAWFFATAFVVFINVHHFFIDSVVWKFQDEDVRSSLLYK